MQQVNGVPVYPTDPSLLYEGLNSEPTWFSAQGGVYRCYERSTHKQVAIKKYLVEEDNPYPDMFVMPKELVENEIYTMTKCIHPNILKLYAVHLHEEFVYLIMPLCTGGSLQQYVFEHQLTIGQLVHIIYSIASGLAKVHGYGYIHRDIKCDNIFLDEENNNIVLGDFGVVSISPAADSSVEEAGVVLFWSPELVQQKIINHKVDIWALGVVILEVLNGGKAPYEDENLDEDEIKQRIIDNGRPEYPTDLPHLLIDLLDHCLDPDPRTRYSANSVLKHPFLKSYEPELLFPATKLDQSISSQSDFEPLEIMQDIEQDFDRQLKVDSMEGIQAFDNEDCIMIEKRPLQRPKCRLPIPAFSVDKSKSVAVPVKEKIANVIRKRQDMSSQGSRIPMLCSFSPIVMEEEPKLRTMKISTSIIEEKKQRPKSLARSNTIPHNKSQTKSAMTEKLIPISRLPHRSPLSDIKSNLPKSAAKKESTPKSSVYRKRLPANESRTARLMMGLSSRSFKDQQENRLFHQDAKKRPISFALSSSKSSIPQLQQQLHTSFHNIPKIPSPEITRTHHGFKRQSVPAPPSKSPETERKSNKGNLKALRVH